MLFSLPSAWHVLTASLNKSLKELLCVETAGRLSQEALPDHPTAGLEVYTLSPVGWYTPVTPALERLRQEDCYEFQASLGYRVRLSKSFKNVK